MEMVQAGLKDTPSHELILYTGPLVPYIFCLEKRKCLPLKIPGTEEMLMRWPIDVLGQVFAQKSYS